MVRRSVPTSVEERQVVLGALEASCETLPALLRATSDADARAPGQGDDIWSIVEVLSHLIDAENRSSQRTRRIAVEDNPSLPVYPDDDYSPGQVSELVTMFQSKRREHLSFFRNLTDADWERRGRHELYGELSIEQLARLAVCHDAEHLAQISRRLR